MLRKRFDRSVRTQVLLALCGGALLSACAAKYTQVPPRLDLAPYGRVAVLTFSGDRSHAAMNAVATQRFAEAVLASQSGIELLELSAADSSLRRLAAKGDGPALALAVGQEKDVPALFVGDIKVSRVKPSGKVSASGLKVRTAISAQLTIRLLSTRTGGTVWRRHSTATETIHRVAVADGLPSVSMRDEDDAYGELVRELVAAVTRDLRPTLVKQ